MLLLLANLLISSSIKLTAYNFDEVVKNSNNKSMVIEFWDPWCHHCAAFRPTWNQLTNSSKLDVIFADTNCVENKAFCKKISSNGYPQVLYYDTIRKVFIEYDGPLTIDAIESFIHKQINFPIIFLDSYENLTPYRLLTNVSTLFVMEIPIKKKNYTQIFRDLAIRYRNSTSNFVLLYSDKMQLSVFKSYEDYIFYDGDWSLESIDIFIKSNLLPLLAPLTENLFDNFILSKELCFTIFIDNNEQFQESLNVIQQMNLSIQFFYFQYEKKDYFCRFVGVKQKNLPQLYVIDIAHQLWTYSTEKFTSNGIEKWINDFDHDKMKWRGPGVGIFSDFYSTFYTIWANGGLTLAVVVIGILFILLLVCYTIYDMCTVFREDPIRMVSEKEE